MTPGDATTVVIDKDAALCVCAMLSRGDDNLSRMCGCARRTNRTGDRTSALTLSGRPDQFLEAMSAVMDRPKVLIISWERLEPGRVRVAVKDTGAG